MKINLPVTQNEHPYAKGKYLVSKTDLKGIITYANEAFVEMSGYTLDELVGKNHNLVRHPDMPPQAFADLWTTVKKGLPWRGVVKNRCKNGDHYWVDAFVVPVRKNDETIGYMSVRSEPTRKQVKDTEALYAELNRTKGRLPGIPFWKWLSISARLRAVMAVMALIIAGSVVIGLYAITQANQGLRSVYEEDLASAHNVGEMLTLAADSRTQMLLALQHDPVSPFASQHDHPINVHLDRLQANAARIDAIWDDLLKSTQADVQAPLRAAQADFLRYRQEGVVPMKQKLAEGDFMAANRIMLGSANPLYSQVETDVKGIEEVLEAHAQGTYVDAVKRYGMVQMLMVGGLVFGVLMTFVGSVFLIRSIVDPMRKAVRHFDRISQGSLIEEIDIGGRDESGLLLCAQAAMQVNIKVMLDEIAAAVGAMEERVAEVRVEMRRVTEQSRAQSDRVQGVASATEEFSQSVHEVAESADTAASAAQRAQDVVRTGTANMASSMAATGRVVESVRNSGSIIGELSQAVQRIGEVSQVIKDIADQTNLLALNAAIEAARAGELGRGFAVVADEVRKLAERTTASTGDINEMVHTIQTVTRDAVSSMDQAVAEVEEGIGSMQASRDNLSEINKVSDEVNGMARHIASAAKEQAIASEDVANNIERISSLIEENHASAQQARHATEVLSEVAAELRALAGRFELIRK